MNALDKTMYDFRYASDDSRVAMFEAAMSELVTLKRDNERLAGKVAQATQEAETRRENFDTMLQRLLAEEGKVRRMGEELMHINTIYQFVGGKEAEAKVKDVVAAALKELE